MNIALVLTALIVAFIAFKVIRGSGVKGYARGFAKAQLRSFLALQSKYPTMKPEALYVGTLKLRPGWSDERARTIVDSAKEDHEDDGTPFNLQQVVYWAATQEYTERTGKLFTQVEAEIETAVKSVIPSNL